MDNQDPYAGIGTVDAVDPYAGIGTIDAPADPYADVGAQPESRPPKRLAKADADYPLESVGIIREAGELAKLDVEQLAIFGDHTNKTLRALEDGGKLASEYFKNGSIADVNDGELIYFEPGFRPGDTSSNQEVSRALALQAKGAEVFGAKREPDAMEFGPLTEAYRLRAGRVEIDPYRYKTGVKQAVDAKVLTSEQAATLSAAAAQAEKAVSERVKLLEDAGKDPKTKALLLGLGRGAVVVAGAKGGAMAGAAVPGTAQTKAVTGFIGGVAGALVTSAAERAIEERIAKHSEALNSLRAAGALEPRIAQGGELAAFVVTAPAAIGKLADATRMVAADAGKKAAAGFVTKQVGAAAAIGAGVDTAVQGGMMMAGVQPEFSTEQLGILTAISALLAGHGVKFRNYKPAQVEDIVKRGIVMDIEKARIQAAGDVFTPTPPPAKPDTRRSRLIPENTPSKPEIRPLNKEEEIVYRQAVNALEDLAAAGKVPAELELSARQMLSFSRPITELTTSAKMKPAGVIGADPYAGIGTPVATPPPPATPGRRAAQPLATVPNNSANASLTVVPKGGVVEGAETVVFGARGTQFPARYVWARTSETETSHTGEMMGANPRYPLENTRDYGQPEERDKQLDTRNNFDPRRHVTDAPDASTGPRMAATIIGEDGVPVRTTLGGNNRGWAITNLPPEKRAALRELENAKAANFGLAPTNDPDAELQRDLGTFDLRQPGERERLQGIVDVLNPSPGMVQAHAKRAEIDAQNIAPSALEGMAMDLAPGEAQEFVRGLIASGAVDRNLAGSLAENPGAAQDYTQRLLANAAFRTPALANTRMDARSAGTTTRGLLDAAVPALLRLRSLGDDGNAAADAVARTFVNVLKSGAATIQSALDTVSRQTEFDPASIVSRVIAQGLQAAVVPDAKGRPIPEPTIANAATLFRLIDRTVRSWQADQAQAGDLLGGRQESAGDAVIRAVTHFVSKGLASASEGGKSNAKAAAEVAPYSAPPVLSATSEINGLVKAKAEARIEGYSQKSIADLVSKYYRPEAYRLLKGKQNVFITAPSTTRINRLPVEFAARLQRDFGGAVIIGDNHAAPTATKEAKARKGYLAKMQDPSGYVWFEKLDIPQDANVVLVDDILTSGETLDGLVEGLHAQGIGVSQIATLAASKGGQPMLPTQVKQLATKLAIASRRPVSDVESDIRLAHAASRVSFITRAIQEANSEPKRIHSVIASKAAAIRAALAAGTRSKSGRETPERLSPAGPEGGAGISGLSPVVRPTVRGENATRVSDSSEIANDSPLVMAVSGSAYAKVPLAGLPDIKPVEMPELVELYKELTGNEVFIKSMPKALGQFVGLGKGMVRLNPRIFQDAELATKVMAHEIGHLIDYLPQHTLKRGNLWGRIHSLRNFMKERWTSMGPTNKEFRAELIALSEHWKPIDRMTAPASYIKYRESGVELYADFISVLFNSPATAKQIAPKFFRNFFAGLNSKPEIKAALFELQNWLNRPFMTRQADRRLRIDEMIALGEEAFLRKFEERKQRFAGFRGRMAMLKQGFFDQYAPIRDRASDAGPTPAALLVETLFDAHPMARNEHWRWLERMDRTVLKPLQEAGFSPDDLGAHLFFDRIANESYALSERQAKELGFATAGRSVIANPGGHTQVTARQALLAERLRNGLKKQTLLEAAVQKFHDEVFAEMREAHKAGLFTDEQMALIAANRDQYAAFIPLEYIDTYVPAGIAQQTGTMKDIASPFLATTLKVLTLQRAIQFQRLKTATVDLMKQSFSAEIRLADTRMSADGRTSPVPPREQGWSQISLRESGKMVWYNVPREVALMFEHVPLPLLDSAVELLSVPFRKVFYPMFITFNPVFQLVTNPIRDIRRTLLTRPMGIGWGAVLRQLPIVKQIGENPALDAVRALVKRGEQMPIIAEMLDNLAITPGEATFSATAGVVDTAFDKILQSHGLLPADEQSRWMPTQWPVLGKVLKSVQMAGRINELLGKVDTYGRLRLLGWNPADSAAFVRNAVGTPNFGRKGKHANIPGAVLPFFNIWTKAWATDAKLASKGWKRTSQPGKAGTSAAAWWMRWAVVSGVPRLVTIAGGMGLLGVGIKKLLDGIGDHDKKNYDVIPVGYAGASEVNPEGKVTYIRIPKDPTDRLITGIFDNLLTSSATALAKQGAFGKEIADLNANAKTSLTGTLAGNLGIVDADVPGLNPLLKIGGGWKTYLSGENPFDSFRDRHVLSEDEHLAGGMEANKTMLAWTLGQMGTQSFFRYNPRSETTTEIAIDNTPLVNGFLKVTDYGYRQQQEAAQLADKMPKAEERLALPSDVRKIRQEFTYLQSLSKFRTPEQTQRYLLLKGWDQAVYQRGMEDILNSDDATRKNEIRNEMKKGTAPFAR